MRFSKPGTSSVYSFSLDDVNEERTVLTEDLAMAAARAAFDTSDGNKQEWIPLADGRTAAPDGTPDKYLYRNTLNPNRGMILFVSKNSRVKRVAIIELKGRTVSCEIHVPK